MRKISIIIATYNRCDSLKDTLDSLLVQEYDGSFEYEVIVVDNNSTDKTKEVAESYIPKFNGRARYVFESNKGLSYARNNGIKEAKGEIIAFTDDDVIADKSWLLNLWNVFCKYNCDAAGGKVLSLYTPETPKWIKKNRDQLVGPIPFHDYGNDTILYDQDKMRPFIGANMAFKKVACTECGLFRVDLGAGTKTVGDDTEFFRRLISVKKNLYYCGKALIWHKVDKKRCRLKYITKWFLQSGRYSVRKTGRNVNLIYYFGIPRYILKEMVTDLLLLFINIFHQDKSLLYLKKIFTNIGQCLEYKNKVYADSKRNNCHL